MFKKEVPGVGFRGLSSSGFESFAGSKLLTRRGKGSMLQRKEEGIGAGPRAYVHWVSVSLGECVIGESPHLSGLYVSICKMGLLITPEQGYGEG